MKSMFFQDKPVNTCWILPKRTTYRKYKGNKKISKILLFAIKAF